MDPYQPKDSLAHRRLLGGVANFRPFAETDLFLRIGGQPTVDTLVDRLYDGVADDPVIRPLFPRDLTDGRAGSKVFFADWLGGGRSYSDRSHSPLRHRHDDVSISRAHAGRWLGHFRRALDRAVPAEADRMAIFAQAKMMAYALVNAADRPVGGVEVAACGVGARTLKTATDLARSGDVAGVGAAVAQAPDLIVASYGATLMQVAALAGRVDVVRLLLDRGVSPDPPHYLPVGVIGRAYERVLLVTPLCAARFKRRASVETVLLRAGATEDVFMSAFLGDTDLLERQLAADPDLARAYDPAADVLDITPVDHAVAGGQAATLRVLLAGSARADRVRALRGAAEKNSLLMVKLLLDNGADATRIGPGRWVLHPDIAPQLAGCGGKIDSSGSWIGLCCTGNQGRKDDPDFVRALLRYGARADDRRTGDRSKTAGVESLAATALHYAARAGFVRTVQVLLEHGADPAAVDSLGRTPLDWLQDAAPTVAREPVRRLLTYRR